MFLNAEPASTGGHLSGERALAQCPPDQFRCRRALVLEVRLHELVVELGDRVDEQVVGGFGGCREVGRNVVDHEVGSEGVRVRDRLHLDEVDDAGERLLVPDRKMDGHRGRTETVAHRLNGGVEVGARSVHLVDERDAGDAIAVRLPPHRLGLGLHAGDGVEDRHGAPSRTRRLRSTSIVKSTWPGVSIMLIR